MNKIFTRMTNRHWCMVLCALFAVSWLVIASHNWLPTMPKRLAANKKSSETLNMAVIDSLPKMVSQHESYTAQLETGFWDGLLATKSIEVQSWRIMGVFQRELQSYIVVKVGDLPPQELKKGDELPDGSRIEGIGNAEICIRFAAATLKPFVDDSKKSEQSLLKVPQGRPASFVSAKPEGKIGASMPVAAQWNVLAEVKVGSKPYYVVMPGKVEPPAKPSSDNSKKVVPPGDIIVNGEKVSFRSGVLAKSEKSTGAQPRPGDQLPATHHLLQPSKGIICLPLAGPTLETNK